MNIIENRLKNNIQTNQFKHRIKQVIRKGKNVISIGAYEFKSFEFNGNLRSDKIEDEKFTNFVSSYNNSYYNLLEDILDKLHYAKYSFLDEFELDEYEASEFTSASERLKRIIARVNNVDVSQLPKIDKFKPTRYARKKEKRYDTVRLYVSRNENGVIDLYLIDLYHLGIDAYNYKTKKYELNAHYRNAENFSKCISKISDKYYE